MNYKETLDYLYSRLPVFHLTGGDAYKPGLDNTIRLMNSLDNPHVKFKSIHIAGTNGKGSVSNMLAAILQSAGYKVGLYTSPHLIDFGERIRINGEMIHQEYVIDFVEKNKHLFDEIQPSFFEATMAMAFNYFADNHVDIAIIEVGLGGRLDSTNIITPEVSVITNIGLDHVEFLGDTLEKIAYEKAGIIKHEIPVVIGESISATKQVFVTKAKQENAPLFFAEEINISEINANEPGILSANFDEVLYKIGLTGKYQLKNAATVLKTIEILRKKNFIIDNQHIATGFENTTLITGLRGRWEILQRKPLIIADTGHNKDGIKVICEQINISHFEKLFIVFGMVKDKDINAVLQLLPKNAVYYYTQASTSRALEASELDNLALVYDLKGFVCPEISEALKAAISRANPNDMILITGSNFVVGEALEAFSKLP